MCGTEGSGDGLCGSCLNKGFNEDALDNAEAERKQIEEAQRRYEDSSMSAPSANALSNPYTGVVENIVTQPSTSPPMKASEAM